MKYVERLFKTERHWTVVVIADIGKIVSFDLSKPWLLASAACLTAMLIVFVYSVVSFRFVRSENKSLTKDLERLSAKLENTEKEREETLVRLMLLEEQAGQTTEKTGTPADQGTDGKPSAEEVEAAVTGSTPSGPEKERIPSPVSKARVSVNDLEIWREPFESEFRFQFTVKKVGRESGKVTGRAFLVLNPEDEARSSWVFPHTSLSSGKPSDFKNGHYFSIIRYTHVRGTLDITRITDFKTAKIYVYSDKGEFLVEEAFLVEKVLRS